MKLSKTEIRAIYFRIEREHRDAQDKELKAAVPNADQKKRAKQVVDAIGKIPKWYRDQYDGYSGWGANVEGLAKQLCKEEFKSKIKPLRNELDIMFDIERASNGAKSVDEIISKVRKY